jgi:hypothetical protein
MKHRLPLFAALLTITLAAAAPACPLCKESIPNSDQESVAGVPNGFNNSVYFMLAGFAGTLGLVTGVVIKGVRSSAPRGGFPLQPKQGE